MTLQRHKRKIFSKEKKNSARWHTVHSFKAATMLTLKWIEKSRNFFFFVFSRCFKKKKNDDLNRMTVWIFFINVVQRIVQDFSLKISYSLQLSAYCCLIQSPRLGDSNHFVFDIISDDILVEKGKKKRLNFCLV